MARRRNPSASPKYSEEAITGFGGGSGNWVTPEGDVKGAGESKLAHEDSAKHFLGAKGTSDALSKGHIRIGDTNKPTVHMASNPTPAQRKAIAKYARESGNPITYDIEITPGKVVSGTAKTVPDLWRAVDKEFNKKQ